MRSTRQLPHANCDRRKEWRKRHPHKYNAQQAVSQALKRGDLQKETCLFCDASTVQAHHHDYTLVLEVTWLCPRHHHLVHGRTKPINLNKLPKRSIED